MSVTGRFSIMPSWKDDERLGNNSCSRLFGQAVLKVQFRVPARIGAPIGGMLLQCLGRGPERCGGTADLETIGGDAWNGRHES
jgi:hypothetical protein